MEPSDISRLIHTHELVLLAFAAILLVAAGQTDKFSDDVEARLNLPTQPAVVPAEVNTGPIKSEIDNSTNSLVVVLQ